MVAGILMHSGRGGGLSDMFGGGAGAALGSSAAERNLTRITFAFALTWDPQRRRAELPARALTVVTRQPVGRVTADTDRRLVR